MRVRTDILVTSSLAEGKRVIESGMLKSIRRAPRSAKVLSGPISDDVRTAQKTAKLLTI
jgi:hypothetical protein